ncbi:MAG TPA: 3-methyladenine DNA glycosylase [Chloroflexi bacterium]|nr:3-methyladenine DNA glycosylase [Chloroflexota bacterium]
MLGPTFFSRSAEIVAPALLGCVIRRKLDDVWLGVLIVETEAYGLNDPASHAFLGRTPSREPMWMNPGTIYMYHSRGGASLNISCDSGPAAVLIKAGIPITDDISPTKALAVMHKNNPSPDKTIQRPTKRLCSGQALLCRALRLSVPEWSGKAFDRKRLYIEARAAPPPIIATARLGIRSDRDDGRQTRFIHGTLAHAATSDPRTRRASTPGIDYVELPPSTSL